MIIQSTPVGDGRLLGAPDAIRCLKFSYCKLFAIKIFDDGELKVRIAILAGNKYMAAIFLNSVWCKGVFWVADFKSENIF